MRGRLILIVVLGAAVAVAVALALAAVPIDWTQTRVQQATLAAIVVAAGWVVTFLAREIGALIARAERLRDVHRALFAEIQHNVANLGTPEDLQRYGDDMIERIASGDAFIPFIPRERHDAVFRAVLPDLHILPRTSIDPVVQYYSQLAALGDLVDDMRGDGFKALSPRRRAQVYADYIAIKIRLVLYGTAAIDRIDAYAKGGSRRARQVAVGTPVNIPGADRSGP